MYPKSEILLIILIGGSMYSYRVCDTFILIFEFTLMYLLYVLFLLKVEDNFRKRKSQHKRVKICYFLYI